MSKKKKSGKKTALKVIGIILAVVVVFVGVYAALMAWTPAATTYSGEINPYITADAALVSTSLGRRNHARKHDARVRVMHEQQGFQYRYL